MEKQCDVENEFARAFKMAVVESKKETAPKYARDARALHNIDVLSSAYQKLVDEILREEQGEELRESYEQLDKAFRKAIKCEAIDIMPE